MNLIYLNVIRKDAEIFLKYIDDYKYMISLTKADEIIEALEINDAKEYYEYQLVLKQLTNISYREATFLKRIEDTKYLDTIRKALFFMSNTQNNYNKPKLIQFKKR